MNTALLDTIKTAGIVGAGGAGFPTQVKLAAKASVVLVNAAECEPLIRVDQQLLISHTEEFLQGLEIALALTNAQRGIIALKAKHTEAVAHIEATIADKESLEIYLLRDYYPAGDEQMLVKDVLGEVVPRGGIPLAVGCVVLNVETLINVARAQKSKPVVSTFVTLAGAVPAPATYELPVGISYRDVLSLGGVSDTQGKAAIDGGPLMGKLITNLDEPIVKTTKAVILLNAESRIIAEKAMTDGQILRQSRTACLQCQKCTDLCPRDLLGHEVKPHLIMRIANYGLADFEGMKTALGCSECGACALYSCPSDLSPRRVNALIKQQLAEAGVKNDNSTDSFTASEMFDYRKIPVKRLIARLGLTVYDKPAPLTAVACAPAQVRLLLKQHVGAPATAVVAVGDKLKRGDLVGQMEEGMLGANVHASIDGVVSSVDDSAVVIQKM